MTPALRALFIGPVTNMCKPSWIQGFIQEETEEQSEVQLDSQNIEVDLDYELTDCL